MKVNFLLFFMLCYYTTPAQNPVTEYYNKDFRQVRKENAVYYRIISYDDSANPVGVVHDYYLSGKMQWEGQLNKEKQSEGHCIWYYENGQKQAETDCVNGYNIGPYKSWYESGQLMSQGNFVKGNGNERRGNWIYYWENGKVQLTAKFTTNDKMDSLCTLYYENGKIEARGNYIDGITQGVCEYFDVKGKRHLLLMDEEESDIILVLKSVDFFIQMDAKRDKGKKLKSEIAFELHAYGLDTNYVNGKCFKKSHDGKSAEFTLINDKMEGAFISYNKKGLKDEEGNYLNNLKTGLWKYYYDNGNIYAEKNFLNGKENGVQKQFTNGIQTEEYTAVNGLKQGKLWRVEFDDYYSKPDFIEEYEFKNDTELVNSDYKMFYVDTVTLQKKGLMMDGIIKGKFGFTHSTFYYENGNPARIFHLDSTQTNGKYEMYYPSGKLQTQGEIRNHANLIQNSWDSTGKQVIINGNGVSKEDNYGWKTETYYENGFIIKQISRDDSGKVRGISTFKNGLKDGYILYYRNGKKQQEIIYQNGIEIKVTTWYENGNMKMERESESNGKNIHEIYYYENGQKQSESHTVNGRRSGTTRMWDTNGNLIKEIKYDEFGDEL